MNLYIILIIFISFNLFDGHVIKNHYQTSFSSSSAASAAFSASYQGSANVLGDSSGINNLINRLGVQGTNCANGGANCGGAAIDAITLGGVKYPVQSIPNIANVISTICKENTPNCISSSSGSYTGTAFSSSSGGGSISSSVSGTYGTVLNGAPHIIGTGCSPGKQCNSNSASISGNFDQKATDASNINVGLSQTQNTSQPLPCDSTKNNCVVQSVDYPTRAPTQDQFVIPQLEHINGNVGSSSGSNQFAANGETQITVDQVPINCGDGQKCGASQAEVPLPPADLIPPTSSSVQGCGPNNNCKVVTVNDVSKVVVENSPNVPSIAFAVSPPISQTPKNPSEIKYASTTESSAYTVPENALTHGWLKSRVGEKGCCNGPYPGPTGSIHDFIPASSIPVNPNLPGNVNFNQPPIPQSTPSYNNQGSVAVTSPISSGSSGNIHVNNPTPSHNYNNQPGGGVTHPVLPGTPGNIYDSKPINQLPQHPTGGDSQKPCCKGPFPGPEGSIYDSIPAVSITSSVKIDNPVGTWQDNIDTRFSESQQNSASSNEQSDYKQENVQTIYNFNKGDGNKNITTYVVDGSQIYDKAGNETITNGNNNNYAFSGSFAGSYPLGGQGGHVQSSFVQGQHPVGVSSAAGSFGVGGFGFGFGGASAGGGASFNLNPFSRYGQSRNIKTTYGPVEDEKSVLTRDVRAPVQSRGSTRTTTVTHRNTPLSPEYEIRGIDKLPLGSGPRNTYRD